eukprot:SAG31_NODE_33667_length_341_cov_0.838843_1_plen_74_part_01
MIGVSKEAQQYRNVLFQPIWEEETAAAVRKATAAREIDLFEPSDSTAGRKAERRWLRRTSFEPALSVEELHWAV